jgi:tRNA nucleotidyltransferase (CCA-adding enzyme)
MDEESLRRKLAAIESLFSGATTAGERDAAGAARERILARLKAAKEAQPAIEYQFSLADEWQRRLFIALLRRYGLVPYRYRGQRYTTVMVQVPERFVKETLWPQYQQLSKTLHGWLEEVANRIIREVLQADGSSIEEKVATPRLGPGGSGPATPSA